jgi:arylsulfatase A-like enzyme
MPTLLDVAGAETPKEVDGRSILPLLRGDSPKWREYVHGECAIVPSMDSGMQYVTDGKTKYVYYPGTGQEELFDLESDPAELENLVADHACADLRLMWRRRLVEELDGRPEGFVDGGKLAVTGTSASPCLPGYEREQFEERIRANG